MKHLSFRKYFLILLVIILSFILITFIFRDSIVSTILTKKIDRFNATYHAGLKIDKIRIQWLASIMMTGISIPCDRIATNKSLLLNPFNSTSIRIRS